MGYEMAVPKTLRGDICAILNPMVGNGTIGGFSTNLSEKELVVTVKALSQAGDDDAFRMVTQALAPLGRPIVVHVDQLDTPAAPTPAGAK
jgi:hypothetical protein